LTLFPLKSRVIDETRADIREISAPRALLEKFADIIALGY